MKKLSLKDYTIQTKRLIIRPVQKSDFSSFEKSKLNSKNKMNEWDFDLKNYNHEKAKKNWNPMVQKIKENRENDIAYQFGIFRKNDNAYLGYVGFGPILRDNYQTGSLGYTLINSYWGQGYAKEAIKATMLFGFKKLNLHRIQAEIEPNNRRSIILARSLKMRRECISKKRILINGIWKDVVVFVMTSEDCGVIWKQEKK